MPTVFFGYDARYIAFMERKKPKPRTRRVRSGKNRKLVLTERDLVTFDVLQGGPLSSLYLHEITKHLAHDMEGHRKRLRMLYDLGYLERPGKLNNENIFGHYAVYKLDKLGEDALKGRLNKYAPRHIATEHNFWNATIMANLRLNLPGFISAEEILARAPYATRTAERPLAIPGVRTTEPDDLLGKSYENGERFFAIETDLDNENYTSKDASRKSMERMILGYKEIIENGAAKEHFGIPNFFVLIFTPRQSRTRHIMEQTEAIYGEPCRNILFKTVPQMAGEAFKPPLLMPEIATEPFLRAGESTFDILNPDRQ